jgi:hypothetical protein
MRSGFTARPRTDEKGGLKPALPPESETSLLVPHALLPVSAEYSSAAVWPVEVGAPA